MSEQRRIGRIKLRDVRLAFWFPAGRHPKKDDGNPDTDRLIWNPTLLISKEAPEGQALKSAISDEIKAVMREKWAGRVEKLKPEKYCIRDGDDESYDGFAAHWYVSVSSNRIPTLVDRIKGRDNKWLEIPATKLYSGCYVNAIITIWAQDNTHGKRINASIEVLQFLRDGDSFGAGAVDANDELDDDDVGAAADISSEDEDVL